ARAVLQGGHAAQKQRVKGIQAHATGPQRLEHRLHRRRTATGEELLDDKCSVDAVGVLRLPLACGEGALQVPAVYLDDLALRVRVADVQVNVWNDVERPPACWHELRVEVDALAIQIDGEAGLYRGFRCVD